VVVAYILVAVIHLNNTGYFCYAFAGEWLLKRDRRQFQNIHNQTQKSGVTAVTHKFEYIYTNLQLVPIRFPDSREEYPPPGVIGLDGGLPKQIKEEADRDRPNYTLFTWGIFTDQQLQAISNAQMVTIKKLLVASHGVKHQLDILVQTPALSQGATAKPARAI
jgi:hypothetical protein